MGYKLLEMKEDAEFGPVIEAFRVGFTNPGNPIWPLFTCDWQDDPAARRAAMEESTARLILWHRHDPTSTWLKVVDEETGEVVAGGRWSIYERGKGNPYDGHGPVEATWYPEGDPRLIASKLMNDFLATAAKHVNRPHAFLNILFTVPEHRRRGCAAMVMDWGFEKAREQELDVFIEATKEGKPLYEKYGLEVIDESFLEIDESTLPPTTTPELRKAVIKALTPFKWWSMLKTA